MNPSNANRSNYDVVIVGAGFAGLYAIHKLRKLGFSLRVFEAGSGVGGTWYWNRYPGARCDVESLEYSYSFDDELQKEWTWSERYSAQPEILKYIEHVADRFELKRDIQFNTRVKSAVYDEAAGTWTVTTDKGDTVTAQFVIMATGCLSTTNTPKFKGLETYKGEWYHTGTWPKQEPDLRGKRVGVIGTGSSGIQVIPVVARTAKHLTVFQRTPAFSIPARNTPLPADEDRKFKQNFREIRARAKLTSNGYAMLGDIPDRSALATPPEERERIFREFWDKGGPALPRAFKDIVSNKAANETACEFVRNRIRDIVKDPKTAELLCPKTYAIGTKRICVDTDYYATYNRDNVTLVNVKDAPIEEITPTGLRTTAASYDLDVIIFATGFDALTGTLLKIDIRGRNGESLAKKWEHGPRTYLGLAIAGFPNLLTVTGPGSPSVFSNVITSIEQHVDWITDCLDHLKKRGLTTIEATQQAEDDWGRHVNELGNGTLYPETNSWYVGANVPGKPRAFLPYIGGVGNYRKKCDEIVARGYEGFELSDSQRGAAAA